MAILIVTDKVSDWPLEIPGVEVADARRYLTDPEFSTRRNVRLFNLCRAYKYQSTGYYVSLLAEARGHRPVPNIITLQDVRSQSMVRLASEELDELIQHSLSPLQSDEFSLSVYFGRNLAKRYERLSRQLFELFQAPLLKFRFARDKHWQIRSVKALAAGEIPDSHRDFVVESATRYFSGRVKRSSRRTQARYDLAILHDPKEVENSPSDMAALKKFQKAGEALGLATELITREDYGRLLEFDALFIRETTAVNHHTYRFARRAASEGMVVIDDPLSIVRCTNKVYLAELLTRHKVSIPKTMVVHRDNASELAAELGLPCVIKRPDSSFSLGVVKARTESELNEQLAEFFTQSELVVAQEYLSTDFDWRIGILDQRPLYACKYYMAPGHWQIIQQERDGRGRYGRSETLPVELAPRKAVQLALKAANLIGNGLYGVDVKESNGQFFVIEVNDNPNIDSKFEDRVLRDELYRRIMEVFLRRIEQKKVAVNEPR